MCILCVFDVPILCVYCMYSIQSLCVFYTVIFCVAYSPFCTLQSELKAHDDKVPRVSYMIGVLHFAASPQ